MATNEPDGRLAFPAQLDADSARLDTGYKGSSDVRRIELGQTQYMDHVKFETGAIRKDFGTGQLGTVVATNPIMAIGEHALLLPTGQLERLIFRIFRIAGGFAQIQTLDAAVGDWVDRVVSTEPISATTRFLSHVSIQGVLATADGENPIMVWQVDTTFTPVSEIIWVPGTFLTDTISDKESVLITQVPSAPTEYKLIYDIDFQGAGPLTWANFSVTIGAFKNYTGIGAGGENPEDSPLATVVHTVTPGLVGYPQLLEELLVTDTIFELGDSFDVIITKQEFDGTAPVTSELLQFGADPNVGFQDSPPNYYTFEVPGPQDAVGGTWNVRLVADALALPIENGDRVLTIQLMWAIDGVSPYSPLGQPVDIIVNEFTPAGFIWQLEFYDKAASGNDRRYGITFTSPNADITAQAFDITQSSVFWQEDGDLRVLVTPVSVDYEYDSGSADVYQQINPVNYPLEAPIAAAPIAKYVGAFGDRLFALWNDGDSQELSASSDGDVFMWELAQTGLPSDTIPDDSWSAKLLDTRIDPIDDLIWFKPLSSQIALLARRRSTMRVFETGNVAVSVGATHWMDGVGSEYPYSVSQVEGGVMFLGHDRMVYYVTADRMVPVGHDIQESLIKTLYDNNDYVDSAYDTTFEEYIIGIPENGVQAITRWYIFDLGRYLRTLRDREGPQMIWRTRQINSTRIAQTNRLQRASLSGQVQP